MTQRFEQLEFRHADAADAGRLTALLRRAKASWGYPQEWMDAWRSELIVTPDYIRLHRVVLGLDQGETAGFYGLEFRVSVVHLEHLWVEPARMHRGIGRALLAVACRDARDRGYESIELIADPNAEAFYLRHGAIRLGEVQSSVLGTPRILPKMRLDLRIPS